ncbi:MAG: phosphoribosylformylglycinamidine synthase subunit PurS [Chitinophagaceae bacterium]|nr:phosphoribosylformylglycinamidine synthase subunit PurS [Chitinophagaceae bacterium]
MTFTAHITIMPLKELLDPQGKAVMSGLTNLGITAIKDVRIGKHITLQVQADNADDAKAVAEEASRKLLANPVMEQFEVQIAG